MPDVQIVAGGVSGAPLDYVVPGAQEILIKAIAADFDGTGAGGSFFPAVQIVAPGNKIAGTFIANGTVAAGASASVSWAPFLAGGGPNGIRFDTDNQGGYLDVTANATSPTTGVGIYLADEFGNGIKLNSHAGGDLVLTVDNGGTLRLINAGTGGMNITDGVGGLIIHEEGGIQIEETGGGGISIAESGGADATLSSDHAVVLRSSHTGGSLNAVQVVTNADDSFSHKDATSGAILFQTTTHGVWGFLRAGGTFTLFDHNNVAILQVEEATPAYRIKAGHAWVANL